jgi:hypothetical protein
MDSSNFADNKQMAMLGSYDSDHATILENDRLRELNQENSGIAQLNNLPEALEGDQLDELNHDNADLNSNPDESDNFGLNKFRKALNLLDTVNANNSFDAGFAHLKQFLGFFDLVREERRLGKLFSIQHFVISFFSCRIEAS